MIDKNDILEVITEEQDRKKAKQLLEMYEKGSTGSFHTALFDAIRHADNDNLDRLMKGFPEYVWAYLNRYNS